jgi:hypothetical protein
VSESGIVGGLGEIGLAMLRSRVVGDEVEVLARRRGDAERLLHEAVCLVAVALRLVVVVVLVASPTRLWGLV